MTADIVENRRRKLYLIYSNDRRISCPDLEKVRKAPTRKKHVPRWCTRNVFVLKPQD